MENTCRMCGEPATGSGRTNEHLIPKWLLDEFKLQKNPISYTPIELQEGPSLQLSVPNQETPRCAHHMGGLLLGSVCSDCNNGWMSGLEGRVKPDLIRLIPDPAESPP
jgi:hypothetical protein